MGNRLSFLVAPCLLSLLFVSTAEAVVNNLTYAAALGGYGTSGTVTNFNVTGEAAMTVTLYDSPDQRHPLWSRRMETYVEQGLFSVELTDAAGFDDGARKSRFVKLSELLDQLRPTDTLWIGISNLTVNGSSVDGVGTKSLPPGRLGGTPFAICAERAGAARGDFVVRGDLTTVGLRTRGSAAVYGKATFGGLTVFQQDLTFGSEGLDISGLVQKPTIAGLASLTAETLDLYGTLQTGSLTVTNETGSVLSTATGGSAPRTVAVTNRIATASTLSVTNLTAGALNVAGKLTLGVGGKLIWSSGTLSVPGGIYAAAEMPVGVYSTSAYTPPVTAKHSLSTLTVTAGDSAAITFPGQNDPTWCRLESSKSHKIVTTVLVPVPRNGSFSSTHGAVTAGRKELE